MLATWLLCELRTLFCASLDDNELLYTLSLVSLYVCLAIFVNHFGIIFVFLSYYAETFISLRRSVLYKPHLDIIQGIY